MVDETGLQTSSHLEAGIKKLRLRKLKASCITQQVTGKTKLKFNLGLYFPSSTSYFLLSEFTYLKLNSTFLHPKVLPDLQQ